MEQPEAKDFSICWTISNITEKDCKIIVNCMCAKHQCRCEGDCKCNEGCCVCGSQIKELNFSRKNIAKLARDMKIIDSNIDLELV